MTVARAFGLILKQLRADAGITQEELGARSGYSREYINMLERGRKGPTLTTVFDLADTLKIPAVEMVRKIEQKRR